MIAFVLGNGRSRLALDPALLAASGSVYGCNALYREFAPQVLVATDRPIATAIQSSGYALRHRFYTRKPLAGQGALTVPECYYGFSSGPIAVGLAAADGHRRVYLVGFDLGGLPGQLFNNVYADTEFYKTTGAPATYAGNWQRQLITVARDFPGTQFIRVVGNNTAAWSEFDLATNCSHVTLEQLQTRINNPKDL